MAPYLVWPTRGGWELGQLELITMTCLLGARVSHDEVLQIARALNEEEGKKWRNWKVLRFGGELVVVAARWSGVGGGG